MCERRAPRQRVRRLRRAPLGADEGRESSELQAIISVHVHDTYRIRRGGVRI